MSRDVFDTPRWEKVASRTKACRKILLKNAARLAGRPDEIPLKHQQINQIRKIVRQIGNAAREQMKQVAACDMSPESTEPGKSYRNAPAATEIGRSSLNLITPDEQLSTFLTELQENCRDVPRLRDRPGRNPTVRHVARIAVESARILSGIPLLFAAFKSRDEETSDGQVGGRSMDRWGIRSEYANWLDRVPVELPIRRIATHSKPDADALVGVWLAERYLFQGEPCLVVFVPRNFVPSPARPYDCVLDVGQIHDPGRLVFDHKPPAFKHRDEQCASSLVWLHLQRLGNRVNHLLELVELVHDGDAATRRNSSAAWQVSRKRGLHALIRHAAAASQDDQMLYQAVAAYLDYIQRVRRYRPKAGTPTQRKC